MRGVRHDTGLSCLSRRLVCLVYLVCLVCFVYLVIEFIAFVEFAQLPQFVELGLSRYFCEAYRQEINYVHVLFTNKRCPNSLTWIHSSEGRWRFENKAEIKHPFKE